MNPFAEGHDPDMLLNGGDDTLVALMKELGVAVPKVKRGERYINWEAWWDRAYYDLTDAQRDAIWDALDELLITAQRRSSYWSRRMGYGNVVFDLWRLA